MQRFSRTRVNIEPHKGNLGKHDQSDLTILKNDQHQEIDHDFEEEFDKTLESPKGTPGELTKGVKKVKM